MTRRTVTSSGIAYTVADDDPIPRELNQWAVVRTRAIDELTGEPPIGRVRVVASLEQTPPAQARVLRKMTSRSIEGGICGLVARVSDVASALTRTGEFAARIEVSGYLAHDLTTAIDQARRTMAAAGAGAPSLTVAPGDPIPLPPDARQQFRPGRGVLIERPAATQPDEFTGVDLSTPAGATDVPIAPSLAVGRAAGTRVAGVPLHLPDQFLHRAKAVRLRGRIQEKLVGPASLTPAIGAQIGILGYWPTYPSTIAGAPVAVDFVSVDPPLYFDYPTGATVEHCTLTPAIAPLSRLRAAAHAGSRELEIAPFAALNPAGGDRLQIEAVASNEAEVVVTDGFAIPPDPLGPARVRLRTATAYIHRERAPVQLATVGILANAGPSTREALAGDAVVFTTDVTLLPAGNFLALDNAGPRAAYHRFRRLPAATRTVSPPPPHVFAITDPVTVDTDGYFEWPAIARVAQLEIAVMYSVFSIAQVRFALDYEGTNPLSLLVP